MHSVFFYFIVLVVCTLGSLDENAKDKLDRNKQELLTQIYTHLLTEELRDSEEEFVKDVDEIIQEIRENLIFHAKYKTPNEIDDYVKKDSQDKLIHDKKFRFTRAQEKIVKIENQYKKLPKFDDTIMKIRDSGEVENLFFQFDKIFRIQNRFEMRHEVQQRGHLNQLKIHLRKSFVSYAGKSKEILIFENEKLPYFAIHMQKILHKRISALAKLYAYAILFLPKNETKINGFGVTVMDIITWNLSDNIFKEKILGKTFNFEYRESDEFYIFLKNVENFEYNAGYGFEQLFLSHLKTYIEKTLYPVKLEKNFEFTWCEKEEFVRGRYTSKRVFTVKYNE